MVTSSSGQQLGVSCYECDGSPRALVHILHGMQEHRGRYSVFAEFLARNGICVLTHDHLGHGESISGAHPLGDMVSFDNVVADIEIVRRSVDFGAPYICFGHSMGSFLARIYSSLSEVDGLIACGTGQTANFKSRMMKSLLAFCKRGVPLPVIQKMVIAPLCIEFDVPTDWLSYNRENQAAYLCDSLCGNPFTREGYSVLFDILINLNKKKVYKNCTAKKILLISGEKDPVGEFGKGVRKAEKIYKDFGKDVRTILYKNMTHEILNETDNQIVFSDVLDFCYNLNKLLTE